MARNHKEKSIPHEEKVEMEQKKLTGIYNAKIIDNSIQVNEEGEAIFVLALAGDGWNCIIKQPFVGKEVIIALLNVVGVNSWDKMKGEYVRCILNGEGKDIYIIGNIIVDMWIDIRMFNKTDDDESGIKEKANEEEVGVENGSNTEQPVQ